MLAALPGVAWARSRRGMLRTPARISAAPATVRAGAALGVIGRPPLFHRCRSGVDETGHDVDAAVRRQRRKVGAAEIERRLVGAAGGPAEAHEIVVCFDAADQVEAIAGE